MKKNTQFVYGVHAVKQVLKSAPENVLNVWIQNSAHSNTVNQIDCSVKTLGMMAQAVPRQTLDKMTKYQNHQGVLIEMRGEAEYTEHDLDNILTKNRHTQAAYLILDCIVDPHNLGACIRTADAAGITAIIIPKDRSVRINATVIKVASGAAKNRPIISVVNLVRTIKKLKEAGVWIIGTKKNTTQSIYDINFKVPVAIVMGGENKGMRTLVSRECDYIASIPIKGAIESLNVSVAAGIVLYEMVRQRTK